MTISKFAWWEVTSRFFQIKFVSTLDTTTLINDNFVLYNDIASPTAVVDPFETIDVAKHYSSISRILTLWWKNPPDTDAYTLNVNNLKTFLGEDVGDFTIPFDWVLDSATPESGSPEALLEPNREPVEVEDYSIKSPTWSIVDPIVDDTTTGALQVLDIAPGVSSHHNLQPTDNFGKIDILFSEPIYTNFITPYYFSVTKKAVKKGISVWENVATSVLSSLDSKIISIYMPALDVDGNTVYSYGKTLEEIEGLEFFEPQTKYRLVISTEIGS